MSYGTTPPGERIMRLETEVKEARDDIRKVDSKVDNLDAKVDDLFAELHRIQGGTRVLWALAGAVGTLGAVFGNWLLRKLGIA